MARSKVLEGNQVKKHTQNQIYRKTITRFKTVCRFKRWLHTFYENSHVIQIPTKGRMKFDPHPFQEELLETYNGYRFAIARVQDKQVKQSCGWILIMVCNV